MWPFKKYLRLAYALAAIEKEVILLHSSAVIKDGKAILFSAPAGTGKSTSARLSGLPLLNDDAVILCEKNGRLQAFGSPLGGESRTYRAGSFEVDKIFFINQSKETKLRDLSKSACLTHLMANQYLLISTVFKENPELVKKVLEVTSKLSKGLNAHELYFEKNSNFVKFL